MGTISKDLGPVTAYAYAKEGGYTGTATQFEKDLADSANIINTIDEMISDKADLVNGKVPSSQLPSYVDDVIEGYYKQTDGKFYEESTYETEITGETGKIYVDLTTDNSYRWSGSAFVKINDVDVTEKADKVTNATNGNLAGLDANGNITDSGKKPTDFASSSAGVPKGGTTGQVLKKASDDDYAFEWGESSDGIDMVDGAIYEGIIDDVALKFSSDNNFTLSAPKQWDGTLEYTTDNGKTWTEWDGSQLSGTVSQSIYLRGTGNTTITNDLSWRFTGKYCTGNIENLLDYQTVANDEHPVMADSCYSHMFADCTSLTTAPELPATTLAVTCYTQMFADCTSLTTAPELPATTLANGCYSSMFRDCTSLITPPPLPATTLAFGCYSTMFRDCISLTTAPELPATTLAEYCYNGMFFGCTSLKFSTTQTGEYQYAYRIPVTGTGTIVENALTGMFFETGGTFTDDPTINTTYYTTNQPV